MKPRYAVSAVFFANGLLVGCWALMVPAIIHQLHISESIMGVIILAGGIAAILALALAPSLIDRLGARWMMVFAACLSAPAFLVLQQSLSLTVSVFAFVCVMASLAVQDVAMNANAASLEAAGSTAIMSSFHGFWSAGAMTGALLGGPIIALGGTLSLSLFAACMMLVLVLGMASGLEGTGKSDHPSTGLGLPKTLLPWLFGLAAFTAFVSEGAVIDWSAQFLRKELDSPVALSGLAVGGFSLAMMIARFGGDALRNRMGDRKLFLISFILAAAGFLLVSAAPGAITAAFGFLLAGFGNANLVPIAFSAASRVPGLRKGVGIAAATFCGYAGLLVAPASLGWAGENWGFRSVYLMMGMLTVMLVLLLPAFNALQARTRTD